MSKSTITKATIETLRQAYAELTAPPGYAPGDIVTFKGGGLANRKPTTGIVIRLLTPEEQKDFQKDSRTKITTTSSGSQLFAETLDVIIADIPSDDGEVCEYAYDSRRLRKLTQAELDALPDGEPAHDHNDPACN